LCARRRCANLNFRGARPSVAPQLKRDPLGSDMNQPNTLRHVWASTRRQRLLGSSRPAAGTMGLTTGTLYEFAAVDQTTALRAFDQVLKDPGSYALETRDKSRIDFLFGRGALPGLLDRLLRRPVRWVTLDIWFEEDQEPTLVDVYPLEVSGARTVIEVVYRDISDSELWQLVGLPRVAA
jgi:hypothetical protein